MDNKKNTQENLEQFSDIFHRNLESGRKITFGEIMVVIDTLGLSETQHNAVKQLIARKIDDRTFDTMRVFDSMVDKYLGYDRQKEDAVEILA